MATDYVLRVLYQRLSRALNTLVTQVTQISVTGGSAVPEFDTVADMLAADVTTIPGFARCTNYEAADGIKSLWMRASDEFVDNGSDVRQSTFHPAFFYERVWVKESI